MAQVMEVTADALDAPLLKYSAGAVVGTGGFVDTPNQRLGSGTSCRSSSRPTSPRSASRRSGRTLRLADVAESSRAIRR